EVEAPRRAPAAAGGAAMRLEELDRVLRAELDVEPSPDFRARVAARVAEVRGRPRWARLWMGAAAAAGLVGVIVAGRGLGGARPAGPAPSQPSPRAATSLDVGRPLAPGPPAPRAARAAAGHSATATAAAAGRAAEPLVLLP